MSYAPNFLGTSTLVGLPSNSSVPVGAQYLVNNVGGLAGTIFTNDGTAWAVLNGVATLSQTAIPVLLQSSGSIGNNGALTGITALSGTLTNCYMYFPVNTIAAGVAAGLYYVQMSSATAGTIFNNVLTTGDPTIPTSPTAFSTTGPGAYTQTTGSPITIRSTTILGGVLGVNGRLESDLHFSCNNNANTKTVVVKFGGTALFTSTGTLTSQVGGRLITYVANRNNISSQISAASIGSGSNMATATISTASDQALDVTLQLATATDYIVLESAITLLIKR